MVSPPRTAVPPAIPKPPAAKEPPPRKARVALVAAAPPSPEIAAPVEAIPKLAAAPYTVTAVTPPAIEPRMAPAADERVLASRLIIVSFFKSSSVR